MADSFFGFDTSVSNINDDEGGGGPSEDEYDALNDETFGQDSEEFDWEVEHEHLAEQLESSRRHHSVDDHLTVNSQLEASLSQLVLDETDSRQPHTLGSTVWRHDLPLSEPKPVQTLKNVCTVEELERQMRQKQQAQNYYQPRYPPVILQRPPGLQAPVPLPFAPQQIQSNININKLMGQSQPNQMINQLGQNVNQMGQSVNQMGQNVNQMGQSVNQFMQAANQYQNNQMTQNNMMGLSQNMQNNPLLHNQMVQNQLNQISQSNMQQIMQNQSQMSQNMSQMGQNQMSSVTQMGQNQLNQIAQSMNQMNQSMSQMNQNQMGQNQMGQNVNQMSQNSQMGQSLNQMGQNSQMGQNLNQMGQNSQMGQNLNQMGQNLQMGQNVNQMVPNGNQFGQPMNQYQHMMGQSRMIAPPPGMNMPRQNFNHNMGPYNPTFRASKPEPMPQPMINQYQPKNQSPNSKQSPPKTQQKQAKIDPKTKSRVFNSNKIPQSNLTSQNLVQIIQNTHPILQMNSGYHNASHHPMLNNRNLFNQQFTNQMFNQRLNGTLSSDSTMNGDDGSVGSEGDEYAGLMTQREKQWLLNIQMIQLNTGTPYIHDFYYTVFLERQASKEKEGLKEAHKANQQNHPFYSGGVKPESHTRERHNSNRHNSTSEDAAPRTYVPAQFENSLGKLQCGSVTAPRKIIDVEVVATDRQPERAPSRASTANPSEVPRELKRTKQLLLDIEALYLILLRLEELNDPLAISNALILKEREEKQKLLEAAQKELEDQEEDCNLFLKNIESVHRRPKQESPKSETIDKRQVVNLAVCQKPPVKNLLDEDKDDLVQRMFVGLLHADRLPHALTVRKGRTLVARFLARVPPTHPRLRSLWSKVLRAITTAARRDDGTLVHLAPHYRRYIQGTSGWSSVLESCSMLAEAFDPARTPYSLTSSFTLSCVCALVERASSLVNTPEATSNERQWSRFLKTLARALKNTSLTIARPLHPITENKLMYHLKQLESRTTIEILQRGKSATEFADVSKTDVQEQLIKHLC